MSKVNGSEILLLFGSTAIVGQRDSTLSMAADMLDATTKDSTGKSKEYIVGENGGTISVSGLYDPAAAEGVSEAIGYLKAGTSLTWKFGETGSGETYWTGSGYLSSVDLSGPRNDLASYSINVQITGAVTEGTVATS
jgi:TP901-1 family phage major tail protein